jgi:hypothetical protein
MTKAEHDMFPGGRWTTPRPVDPTENECDLCHQILPMDKLKLNEAGNQTLCHKCRCVINVMTWREDLKRWQCQCGYIFDKP